MSLIIKALKIWNAAMDMLALSNDNDIDFRYGFEFELYLNVF